MSTSTSAKPLPFWMKLVYGSGDFARASYNTLRMFFYAIFLTDVVGLNPFLASGATFIAILWDAVNDPLVGVISDKVRTRWGRRRPFLLWFTIPFGLSFLLLWWAPPWKSQVMLAIHIMLAYMIADTFQTLVTVPYMALTPELAPDYDDRTSLMTVRMTFNLVASLAAAGLGPTILDAVLQAGMTQQQGYLIMGALFGGLAVIPFMLMFFLIKERPLADQPREQAFNLKETVSQLWQNKPFRYAGGIYVLNWVSFDLLALMLPYFLLYWMAKGNLLARVDLFGINLSAETAVFGVLLITATLCLPFWNFVSRRTSKRRAYVIGMSLWIGVQILIWTVQPGNLASVLWLAVLAGIMASNAHVIPESIFPDVIDWDEVIHHERREGLYYGAINFIRKLSSALATFIALQVLGWSGYKAPPVGVTQFTQSPQALTAIRLLTSPAVIILLLAAIGFTWLFPLSRDRQQRIRRRLERRQKRAAHEKMTPFTTFIDADIVAQHLNDPNWVIVDCRFDLADPTWGFEEYQVLHIPGAVYADLNRDLAGPITPETGRHPLPIMTQFGAFLGRLGISPFSQVVVYDSTSGASAARLWWMLKYLRHEKVAVLNGGLGTWNKEKRPLEEGIESRPAVPAYPLPATFDGSILADTANVEHIRLDPAWKLVDARVPERFAGKVEPIDPIPGRIPGALNRFHGLNLDPDGKVKPVEQLKQEYASLLGGIDTGHTVVYCGSGVTSCLHLVAMAHAGLGMAKLYLGSYSQWIRDPSRPIARDV